MHTTKEAHTSSHKEIKQINNKKKQLNRERKKIKVGKTPGQNTKDG